MKLLQTYRALSVFLLSGTIAAACNKDNNPPTASVKTPMRYQLPQGNAPFDPVILDLYKRYDTYILYKFSDVDFNYQFSYNLAEPPVGNGNGKAGPVVIRTADSAGILPALDFMQQYWFSFYPEEFKKKYLPQKILLAAEMYNSRWTGATKTYDTPRVNQLTVPIEGVDHITLPKIDQDFAALPLDEKIRLKGNLNRVFLKHLMYPLVSTVPAVLPQPDAFFKVSDYGASITAANKYKYGFLNFHHQAANRAPDPMFDLIAYLDTICTKPKAALDAWMLNPKVDSSGLTRMKYNILIKHFKDNYNVDIQAIGNKQD